MTLVKPTNLGDTTNLPGGEWFKGTEDVAQSWLLTLRLAVVSRTG